MVEKILEQGINIIENAIVRMEKFATHMHTISVPNIVWNLWINSLFLEKKIVYESHQNKWFLKPFQSNTTSDKCV